MPLQPTPVRCKIQTVGSVSVKIFKSKYTAIGNKYVVLIDGPLAHGQEAYVVIMCKMYSKTAGRYIHILWNGVCLEGKQKLTNSYR